MKTNKKGFTLVELIVVIIILSILGTIGFLSINGYGKTARNSVRISDIANIEKQLELYLQKTGKLPIPDEYIKIYSSGILIGYQGFAGKKVLNTIKINNGGKDPLSEEYYTYATNNQLNRYQIMGFLEEPNLLNNTNINKTYAKSNIKPYSKGYKLGIILNTNNIPIQKTNTGNIDIITTNNEYKAILDNSNIITGTGTKLRKISPNYSCERKIDLNKIKTGKYYIDNYYNFWEENKPIFCDKKLNGLTPVLYKGGGNNNETINGIKVDNEGNIYVWGAFNDNTNIFGENINQNSGTNYYITKLDNNLNKIWFKYGKGLSISKLKINNNGEFFLLGYIENDTNIFGENLYLNLGNYYITKLDKDFNLIWLKQLGTNNYIFGMQIDNDGNIYLGGGFAQSSELFGKELDGNGGIDYFITKLDNNGNIIWIKNGGNIDHEYIHFIELDTNGYIYIGAEFINNTTIFGEDIEGNGDTDFYIAKLDNNGNKIWSKNGGGNKKDYLGGININKKGEVVFWGIFEEKMSLLGKEEESNGWYDYYFSKVDSNGNKIWVKTGGGENRENISGFKTDNNGNIYIGFIYRGTTKIFGEILKSNEKNDIALLMLDSNWNLKWIRNGIGNEWESFGGLDINSQGDIYLGGNFNSNNFEFLGESLTTKGNSDIFLFKLFK